MSTSPGPLGIVRIDDESDPASPYSLTVPFNGSPTEIRVWTQMQIDTLLALGTPPEDMPQAVRVGPVWVGLANA